MMCSRSSMRTARGSVDERGSRAAFGPPTASPWSVPAGRTRSAPCYPLVDRIRMISACIDEENETELYGLFYDIVPEIFGHGTSQGWELSKLKLRKSDNQKLIYSESNIAYNFLCSNGNIFKLCYKLLSNSLIKFNVYFSALPIELRQKLEISYGHSYYGSRFIFHVDSNVPIGLTLNSFEFYMFNFALYGLKLAGDDFSNYNADSNDPSVYKSLCLDYLYYFLPLQHSASMILPQLTFNVLSSTPNEKQYTRTGQLLNFIKKDVAYNDLSNDKVESSSWVLTSEATWRSELVSFYFADTWLNCNSSSVPSIELTKLIRCFIKHLHLYSNFVTHQSTDNLKLILLARHSIKIYQYLSFYMDSWPQDFSFRLLLENWLCYIQPWRYEDLPNQQHAIMENEMNDKWRAFITRNLLCYTKLFYLAIKRFICIDICSPRYSIMVFRMLKVFTHPYLIKIILDIEHMYISNHQSHKKWNLLMSECFVEAEGPLFKYELMFSKERTHEYKLFCAKLHTSLDHVAIELNRFQEEKMNRSNSSMIELILSPKKNNISDYTLSEWEDIQKNLKASLTLLEQIINDNVSDVPTIGDLSTWSVSGISASNTSSNFNNSHSMFNHPNMVQTFKRNTMNISLRSANVAKEWEIDPDYLETLSYENYFLVKLSKFLRHNVECYMHSKVLEFSTKNTILAGVLRQSVIRAPMKIFSYEPRNDGSGKRVRTPKILPPTISFRWIASYFTVAWILFMLTFILFFNNSIFWISLFYVIRIVYYCLKYLVGRAPPFEFDNFHED